MESGIISFHLELGGTFMIVKKLGRKFVCIVVTLMAIVSLVSILGCESEKIDPVHSGSDRSSADLVKKVTKKKTCCLGMFLLQNCLRLTHLRPVSTW